MHGFIYSLKSKSKLVLKKRSSNKINSTYNMQPIQRECLKLEISPGNPFQNRRNRDKATLIYQITNHGLANFPLPYSMKHNK